MDTPTGTILILLIGVCVVVGGILLLRLHAFLALILAAAIVSMLTPQAARERYALEKAGAEVLARNADHAVIATGNSKPGEVEANAARDAGVRLGDQYIVMRRDEASGRYRMVGDLIVSRLEPTSTGSSEQAILTADGDATPFPLAERDLVITPAAVQTARKSAGETLGKRLAGGFGSTCASIGILIAMASIIGKTLLDSGAADRIVRTMLRWFGEAGAPLAFMVSGFLLGVPVFFDTVFYLMIPLGKAMRLRTGRNYLLYVLTIVCGATMAHSLVPPTPGPLFVAEELGVNLGVMILGGSLVGLVTATAGYLYARWASAKWELELRETEDFSLADVEKSLEVDESRLPPFCLAILPVILPVILIAGLTTLKELPLWSGLDPNVKTLLTTLGEKNVAIAIAAVIGLLMLIRQKKQDLESLAMSVQKSLASAGVIILITAAGGAFGGVLRQTGIATLIEELPTGSPALMCTLAFLITTAIRTAQGSATVAMITAVGILGGIELGAHPVYLALAIGCGSKPIAWMNDSGFWVITRMSGMTEKEGLKYVTPMTATMGVVGLLVVVFGVTVWPHP